MRTAPLDKLEGASRKRSKLKEFFLFRAASPTESATLVSLAESTGIFAPHEAESLLGGVLEELHAGHLGDGHQAYVWASSDTSPAQGWVYFAPTEHADGVWDLWWIGVAADSQRQGIGGELLKFVEEKVRSAGGRLLLIETSSLTAFDSVRQFYVKRGYAECGWVPDFYGAGEAKVIYFKRIQ
jgi:GNAT superfamily N-acetyltransferase